jgi:hypothetical protein
MILATPATKELVVLRWKHNQPLLEDLWLPFGTILTYSAALLIYCAILFAKYHFRVLKILKLQRKRPLLYRGYSNITHNQQYNITVNCPVCEVLVSEMYYSSITEALQYIAVFFGTGV